MSSFEAEQKPPSELRTMPGVRLAFLELAASEVSWALEALEASGAFEA